MFVQCLFSEIRIDFTITKCMYKKLERSKIDRYRTLYNLIELIKMYRLTRAGSTNISYKYKGGQKGDTLKI